MHGEKQYEVVVAGLGFQGAGIAAMLLEQGHRIVGAVDVGGKVGRPISEFVDVAGAPESPIGDSLTQLLSERDRVDAVIIAASIGADETVALAREAMSRGANVLTLHQDLFGPGQWTVELDSVGRQHSCSFLSTGAQDTWWVQLPAMAAGSVMNVSRIFIEFDLNIDFVSEAVMRGAGVTLPAREFRNYVAQADALASALAMPLAELARRIGATPLEVTQEMNPVLLAEDHEWAGAGVIIPAGHAVGTEELVSFDTEEGIRIEGAFRVLPPGPDGKSRQAVRIEGDPDVEVTFDFRGDVLTNAALVHRLPDVVAAEPGVHFSSTFAVPRYHFPAKG